MEVTNSGTCDGTEIVQLYLRDVMAEVARPVKELKAFRRIFLKKGGKAGSGVHVDRGGLEILPFGLAIRV